MGDPIEHLIAMAELCETCASYAADAKSYRERAPAAGGETLADLERDRLWCAASLAISSTERQTLLEAFHKLRSAQRGEERPHVG